MQQQQPETITCNDLRSIRETSIEELIQSEYTRIKDEILISNRQGITTCTVTVMYHMNDIISGILAKLRAVFIDIRVSVYGNAPGTIGGGVGAGSGFDFVIKWD
jgi:hypothetical protein